MSVNIKYKNNIIAELTETAIKTLKTSGKYCEADIIVENTKDGGGGGGTNNVSFGTYTAVESDVAHKVEHSLGTTPAALLFVYVGLTTDISAKYDDAPIAHLIPNKDSGSYRWMFYRSRFTEGALSARATSILWSTGTTNTNFDRVNNINDKYFYTPTNCDVGTYFWAVFKEALI